MCGELSVASERRSFQKGTDIGDGIAKVVSDLIRRFHEVDTPCSGDPSEDVLPLQTCYILNLLLGLRSLGGCFWFPCGKQEQLRSWLFGFSS